MNSRTWGLSGVNSRACSATLIKRSRLRVSFTSGKRKFSSMKLRCWISSAPPSTNWRADMNAGTCPLTRIPRACA